MPGLFNADRSHGPRGPRRPSLAAMRSGCQVYRHQMLLEPLSSSGSGSVLTRSCIQVCAAWQCSTRCELMISPDAFLSGHIALRAAWCGFIMSEESSSSTYTNQMSFVAACFTGVTFDINFEVSVIAGPPHSWSVAIVDFQKGTAAAIKGAAPKDAEELSLIQCGQPFYLEIEVLDQCHNRLGFIHAVLPDCQHTCLCDHLCMLAAAWPLVWIPTQPSYIRQHAAAVPTQTSYHQACCNSPSMAVDSLCLGFQCMQEQVCSWRPANANRRGNCG